MKKIYLLATILFAAAGTVWGQQKPQFSQYMLNNYLNNPAVTGIEDYSDLRIGFREQWVGLEGAPRTYYTTFHTPINKTDRETRKTFRVKNGAVIETTQPGSQKKNLYKAKPHHGVGGSAFFDQSGAITISGFNASYAYHLPLSKQLKVAAGTAMGVLNFSLDPAKMNLLDLGDPILAAGKFNRALYDLNMGLWAYSPKFYLGLAMNQLVANKQEFMRVGQFDGVGRLQKHYFLTGGYKINLSSKLSLIPSAMAKLAYPSPLSVDLNLKALYDDRLFIGGSYRREDAILVFGGINISSTFDIGYSYDATTSGLYRFNSGTHEVVMGIKLFNKKKIICPNWLW